MVRGKYGVRLTSEQRNELQHLVRAGKGSARVIIRAELFPTRIKCRSSSRCSGISRTAYLSLTITATPAINTSLQPG